MSGHAVASGALFGAFPGLQWGTSLNAGQLTSDVAAATCISTTAVLASTGGVYASEAWSTTVSSASDSGPTTVVIQRTVTAPASGSAHHILPEDAAETAVTTSADAAESSTRTRALRILDEILTPVAAISEDIAAAEQTTLRGTSATAVPSSTTSTDAVAPISVRDGEDPEHGVWPPRTRDWYCGTVGAGSGTWTGTCAAQTTSVSADNPNPIATTLPVDSEGQINQCVVEGVWMPSPQGGSSGSPGTTTTPFTGYNLKPTTTCEVKDAEAPPDGSTTTSTSTSTSTSPWTRISVPLMFTSPTPVPGRRTSPTSSSSEVASDNDDSEPGEIKTCDIRGVETPPGDSTTSTSTSTSAVPLQEGTSTSHQFAITDPVTTAAPTSADNRVPPKTTPITSDVDDDSDAEEATSDDRDVKTAPEDRTTTSPASSTTAVATGGVS
ncbi:hypothetical protein DL767_008991 [Monosporascus sp. MG133]|nr:hypothetical protein DL767_008991 [Monosporascus sp. MG133]